MIMKNTVIAIAVIVALIALAIAALSILELQASNTLLRKIRLVKPGIYLPSVTNELGRMMYEIRDTDHMINLGSVKDRTFCGDKKLFWFGASGPPCRALEVYTDTNDVVVYVTWQKL